MTPTALKAFFTERLRDVKSDYLSDLEAMDESSLGSSPGGVARTAYDYSFEVSFVNRRIAKRLRGEEPDPFPQGWMVAPAELQSKQAAIDVVSAAMDEVIAAWEALPESELDRKIPLAKGETFPLDLIFLCVYHTGYHDAQLNLVQAIHGDGKMNWKREE